MKMILLALVLLGACATDNSEPVLEYQCYLFATCGEVFDMSVVPVCGTYDDVVAFSGEWDRACGALTLYKVQERECPYVVCTVQCPGAEAVVVDSCEH